MKDRQFLRLLAIVVATGLVLGLFLFRATKGADATAAGTQVNVPAGNAAAPASASDTGGDSGDAVAQIEPGVAPDGSIEPTAPAKEPQDMRGSVNLDPPGTAVAKSSAAPASDGSPDPTTPQ